MKERIKYLDGHRGIAICLVILFHAYARWPDLVPYGNSFANIPPFQYGWLGVQLFFLISGFVILLTLENCKSASEFIFKRWLRLFPGMLFCSLLIFSTSVFFIERPAGSPGYASLLPGLTFLQPLYWEKIINQPITPLEGAFWSIYIEFKFYIFSAIVYYWRGKFFLVSSLILAFLLAVFFAAANKYIGGQLLSIITKLLIHTGFEHFGWFASGAIFYIYNQTKQKKHFVIAVTIGILSSIATSKLVPSNLIAALFILALFSASIAIKPVQKALEFSPIQFLGFISYPLYLIHENAMISMIIKSGSALILIPPILVPIPAILILIIAGYIITKHIEPKTKLLILTLLTAHRRPRTAQT